EDRREDGRKQQPARPGASGNHAPRIDSEAPEPSGSVVRPGPGRWCLLSQRSSREWAGPVGRRSVAASRGLVDGGPEMRLVLFAPGSLAGDDVGRGLDRLVGLGV